MPVNTNHQNYLPQKIISDGDIRKVYAKNLMNLAKQLDGQLAILNDHHDRTRQKTAFMIDLYHHSQTLQHTNRKFLLQCSRLLEPEQQPIFVTAIKNLDRNQSINHLQFLTLLQKHPHPMHHVLKKYFKWDQWGSINRWLQDQTTIKLSDRIYMADNLKQYADEAIAMETAFQKSLNSQRK